ncbi:MAG: histone deacetylase [Chloroflexi bacterium]|nr:histone deacetylase [Chloroflexota bacterium]
MKAFYCDHFVLPLPDGHRFPMQKYALLREQLIARGILSSNDLCVPDAATDEQILRAHDRAYLDKVKNGMLTAREIRRIGFPWSPELVERSRRSVGGTISASRAALRDGVAVNLAGGTHHAARDHGAGFCVFNDAAIAARAMQADGLAQRIAVVDCDVHQGDGTASILEHDSTIFTFSLHSATNFPFRKQQSDLDIGLADAAGDDEYLAALREGLDLVLALAEPELVIYLAGADPFEGDRLGKLALSKAGLAARDRLVLGINVPVAVVMAGGYARHVQDIVDIHLETVRAAALRAESAPFPDSRPPKR